MSRLGNALFTTTQQKVLGLLFTQPGKSFYTKEIIRLTGMGVATIKRELDSMLAAGIISMTVVGNQHHYKANADCPIYPELLGVVKKTFGVTNVIGHALSLFADRIDWAFIFGSMASGKETSTSDVDLMMIGDIGFAEVVSELYTVQETLGREINPKIYSREEWIQLKNKKDAFIKEILAKPRMDVIGDAHGLG